MLHAESLGDEDGAKVSCAPGMKTFDFGGGEKLQSLASYSIPAVLAGRDVTISTDVVDSDLPLLLSLTSMETAKVKLDVENDSGDILGTAIPLNHTSSSHYCVSIVKTDVSVEEVCAVKLNELSEQERRSALLKLHRQFARPPQKKLVALMMDANVWRPEFEADLETICQTESCQPCKIFARTPPTWRFAVALPMATRFNEKIAMDLKKWRGEWILHVVDMRSRFTVSVFFERNKPSEIIGSWPTGLEWALAWWRASCLTAANSAQMRLKKLLVCRM